MINKFFLKVSLIFLSSLSCKKENNKNILNEDSGQEVFIGSCTVDTNDYEDPKGIYNELNFCYLISLLQSIAPLRVLYDSFKENSNDPVALMCYNLVTKIRSGKTVNKFDIRKLINILAKQGWLKEHNRRRKSSDPRDPSFLLKFLLDRISQKYLKLMSIIKDKNFPSEATSYCVDEGNSYDKIEISCSIDNFKVLNPDLLVIVSVYDDDNLGQSITHRTLNLTIPKEHANSNIDLHYTATSFVQVTPNGNGTNHATAYVKRKNHITGNVTWYHCNDCKIKEIPLKYIENLIKSEFTLLVFYERDCSK